MRRLVYSLTLAAAVATGAYGWWATGRLTASVVFLALAAASLVAAVAILFRAAAALVRVDAEVEGRVATGRRRKELEREKQMLLKALKELEFDHEMGKVSDADFTEIGGQYRARAVRVLRQLDQAGSDYRALIAREVAARLKARGANENANENENANANANANENANENENANANANANEDRLPCSACGTGNEPDAAFCKSCGQRMTAAEVAT